MHPVCLEFSPPSSLVLPGETQTPSEGPQPSEVIMSCNIQVTIVPSPVTWEAGKPGFNGLPPSDHSGVPQGGLAGHTNSFGFWVPFSLSLPGVSTGPRLSPGDGFRELCPPLLEPGPQTHAQLIPGCAP